jgi:hypothetical protein
MNNTPAYRPEDMEALLQQKAFHELYAEEKKFVLEHLESEAEYERLRALLLGIRSGAFTFSDPGSPDASQRTTLLDAFAAAQNNNRRPVWNFTLPQFWNWNNSGFRYAMGVMILLVATFFTLKTMQSDKPEFVKKQNDTVIPQQIVKQQPQDTEKIKITPAPVPPAPSPVSAPQPNSIAVQTPVVKQTPQTPPANESRALAADAGAMGLFYTAL